MLLFSAGNCGEVCPSPRCETSGPGQSSWEINSHLRAMTVGAAILDGEWIGYSSQGPGSLARRKPDFCAITRFKGHTPSDNSPSAACPVAAGVVELLSRWFPTAGTKTPARGLSRRKRH